MHLSQVIGHSNSKRNFAAFALSRQTLIRKKQNIFNSFEECTKIQRSLDVERDFRSIKTGQSFAGYLIEPAVSVVT